MNWLSLLLSFILVFIIALSGFLLASMGERRRPRGKTLERIVALLPGYDCGLCGFAECHLYAKELINSDTDPSLCPPGGADVEKAIRIALGGDRAEPKIAFVKCGGNKDVADDLFYLDGYTDCYTAINLFNGPKGCKDGCLGLGSCCKVCRHGAITLQNGIAKIDAQKCSGCGACISACPKELIVTVPSSNRWNVLCAAKNPLYGEKRNCKKACTACGICTKLSPNWEFTIKHGIAQSSLSVSESEAFSPIWKSIADQCPTGVIQCVDNGKKDNSAS